MLLPCVVLCSCGTAAGIPLVWFVNTTVEASRGGENLAATVTVYLDALGHESETGLVAILDDFRGEQLLAQWRRYLTDMERGGNPPA